MERIQGPLSPVLAQMRGCLRAGGWTNTALSGVCSKNTNLVCLLPFPNGKVALDEVQKSAEGLVVGLEAWLQAAEAMGAGLSVSTKLCPPHYPWTQSPLPPSLPSASLLLDPYSPSLSPHGVGKFPSGCFSLHLLSTALCFPDCSSSSPPPGPPGARQSLSLPAVSHLTGL